MDPTDLIETVKGKIEEIEGTPAKQQRLIHEGKALKNGRTLENYHLKNMALVHLVKALRSQ